jgi:hypothetical protein
MNASFVVIFALVVAVATAAPSNDHVDNKSIGTDLANLTTQQRICIADAVKADPSIITALKSCYDTNGGLACVKAIPALASCFA